MKATNKKYNPYNSMPFLVASFFCLVRIQKYAVPYIDSVLKLLIVPIFAIALLYKIKNDKFSKLFLLIVLYWLSIAISTIINSGDYLQLLQASLSSLLLCLTIENGYRANKSKTLKSAAIAIGLMVILNSITMFVFYDPNPRLRGMYCDGVMDCNYYLLGQDNGTIFYALPAALMFCLYSIDKKGLIDKKALLLTSLIGLSYLLVFSGAGIVSFLLFLLLTFFVNNKLSMKVLEKLTVRKILLIIASVFLIVVIARTNNIIITAIANMLGKSLTFTGRTRLWDIVIGYFLEKPILGYGLQDTATRLSMIPYGKAHNTFLQIAYNGGIVAIVLFFAIILQSCKMPTSKNTDSKQQKTRVLILGYIFIVLLVGNFDFYIFHSMTFLPMILIFQNSKNKESIL